jgi:hypothetical protein
MTTLAYRSTLRTSGPLRVRIAQALVEAAAAILAEDPATVNHGWRRAWAEALLADPFAPTLTAEREQWRVVADPAVLAAGEDATDAEIVDAVAARLLPALIRVQ